MLIVENAFSGHLKVFFSNQLEILYHNLKKTLFLSSTPFKRRLIVVYGPAMKNWLLLKMADDPDLQVAMGIEIVYLNEIFEKLLLDFGDRTHHLPSQLELALLIEQEILKILINFESLEAAEQNIWNPIIQYLKIEKKELTLKSERRLIGLSQQMARCFKEYGRTGNGLVKDWEENDSQEWQQRLWRSLFSDKTGWTYPCKVLQNPLSIDKNCEIHFFSISFISKCEFQFLHRISHSTPTHYYLLSPCAMFWSDIQSDKESAYLQSFWRQKLGQESSQVNTLEEFLRDRNPLLANFGRLGREMAVQIEESQAQTEAHYVLPCKLIDEDIYVHEDVEQSDNPLTLLRAVQSDVLTMRNPQGKSARIIDKNDMSIQLHIAPTKRREVQILYHNLLRLIEKEFPHITPEDIVVMAPAITEYVPYIQSIFGAKESQLDYQILDLGLHNQSEMIKGFLQLITLSESRWNAVQLLQLFEYRSFQRRFQLSESDFSQIQSWIEKTGILWGETWQHRNELLERSHCQHDIVEDSSVGTWDYGINRLLMGLTTILEKDSHHLDVLPFENIDFSQADLLGKWIHILHALRDDLTPLHDQSRMTIEDWINYLHCLLESYFQPDYDDNQSQDEYASLKAQFEVLRHAGKASKDYLYSFESIKTHLQNLLHQKGMIYRENCLQAVRFCSMVPLRSIPSKVVAILGMQEGAFPRHHPHSSLNLIVGRKDSDYCPTTIDYDRYLFLEALHSTRDYLLLSYQGYSHTDGKELQPSLLVEELFSYLDKYYLVEGEKPSEKCTYQHPFDSFDVNYFKDEAPLANFSLQDFQAAEAFQADLKDRPHAFLNAFEWTEHPQEELIPNRSIIDLKYLTAAARNPIKFHLNHVLEIYLQTTEDRQIKTDEELVISPLDKYQIKQQALKESANELLKCAEKEGKLPPGLFKEVASHHLKEEISNLKTQLTKHRIEPDQIFNIEFLPGCLSPRQLDEMTWIYPALPLKYDNGYTIYITGKLSHITPQGLLLLSKGSLNDVWKGWPPFLVFLYAMKLFPIQSQPLLIPLQASKTKLSFVEDPENELKKFVHYYVKCLKNFSPLMPEWIALIVEGNAKGLTDKMTQTFSSRFGSEYQDLDLRWILNKRQLPESEKIIQNWREQANILAGDLMSHWYAKEKHEEV